MAVAVGQVRAKGTVDSRARLSIAVAAIQPEVVRDAGTVRTMVKATVIAVPNRSEDANKEVTRLLGIKNMECRRAAEVVDHMARERAAAKTDTDTTELAVAMVADADPLLLRRDTVDAPGRIAVVVIRQATAAWKLPAAHEAAKAPVVGVTLLEAAGADISSKSPTRRMAANPARTQSVAAVKATVLVRPRRPWRASHIGVITAKEMEEAARTKGMAAKVVRVVLRNTGRVEMPDLAPGIPLWNLLMPARDLVRGDSETRPRKSVRAAASMVPAEQTTTMNRSNQGASQQLHGGSATPMPQKRALSLRIRVGAGSRTRNR